MSPDPSLVLVRRLLAVLLLTTACAGTSTPAPTGIDGLRTFEEQPKDRHSTDRQSYDHTPPAGGVHWPAQNGGVLGWLRCGVYDSPVPNEFAVHSEEHGAVWLTYLPGEDPAPLVALQKRKPDYVLVSPYAGQPGKVMASTWGAQLSVDEPDDPRLEQFVSAYAGGGQGGEEGADCANGTLPGPAQAALDKANPS
ncbi:MAG: hypothetical protein JWN77_1320 [Frankiales bacterium]|jgi:hypothetical protein|nr:hypothetical protein [Frankiales bacterium]